MNYAPDLSRNPRLATELIIAACDQLEQRPDLAPLTIQQLLIIAANLAERRITPRA